MTTPFIQDSAHLRNISRFRVSEGRDLINGLRLDRNERVEDWPPDFLSSIFSSAPASLLSTYPDQTRLYQLLSDHHNIDVQELLLTSGIDGGLRTILEVCTQPGDFVGVLSPTYAMYQVYSDIFQLNLHNISYNSETLSIDFNNIYSYLDLRPKVFILPNPNQPIEDTLSLQQIENIAQYCLSTNTLLVVDEAYHLFGADTAIPLVRSFPNVVITRTFSKAFGLPSIRLGYLISNIANMSVLSKNRLAHESNSLTNYVAEYMLLNFSLVQDYIDAVVDSRSRMADYLKSLNLNFNVGVGNYILIDLGSSDRAKACVSFLRDRLVYVKGPWADPYSRFITITLGPYNKLKPFRSHFTDFISSHD